MNSRVLKGSATVLASVVITLDVVGYGGKSSKGAVKAGIIKMIKKKSDSTYAEGVFNDYTNRVVDGGHDEVNFDTLQKLADGKIDVNAKTNDENNKAVAETVAKCVTKLAGKDSRAGPTGWPWGQELVG